MHRITAFYDHIYRDYDGNTPSTDLCWDTFWGLNVNGSGVWLADVQEMSIDYESGTGILHVIRDVMDMEVNEYYFSPFSFEGHVMVMLIQIISHSSNSAIVSAYSLHNFHAGYGAPEADFSMESVTWQDGAFIETGVATGHTFIYKPIILPSRRRTDGSTSAGNPYFHISDPAIQNQDSTGGAIDDAIVAFQWFLGSGGFLLPGESAWIGVVIAYGHNPDPAILKEKIETWIGGRTPSEILEDEITDWLRWVSAPGVIEREISDPERLALATHSLVMLRMGQVRERGEMGYGYPYGQIVASLPPGMWNITWPRDQAYATVALINAGFIEEARAAIEFVLHGQSGRYADEVGSPDYLVSVCRYHGGGFEESDGNPDIEGPNIEFDNFGLFLWSVANYLRRTGDTAFINEYSNEIFTRTADVIVGLIEPDIKLLSPDSSIWERHWNGNQKHFAYSSIMAVVGLCGAAEIALMGGLNSKAVQYTHSARDIFNGIMSGLIVPSENIIGQSKEEILTGNYVDAATVEALNFGLVSVSDIIYDSTLSKYKEVLWQNVTQRGYKRNDDGDWYDQQEWIFVDLRIAKALKKAGRLPEADALIDWVAGQSLANKGLIAELYDSVTADYKGAVPMMGFGAGAFILSILPDRDVEVIESCLFGIEPDGDDIAEERLDVELSTEDAEQSTVDVNEEGYDLDFSTGRDSVDEENLLPHRNGGCGCSMVL